MNLYRVCLKGEASSVYETWNPYEAFITAEDILQAADLITGILQGMNIGTDDSRQVIAIDLLEQNIEIRLASNLQCLYQIESFAATATPFVIASSLEAALLKIGIKATEVETATVLADEFRPPKCGNALYLITKHTNLSA